MATERLSLAGYEEKEFFMQKSISVLTVLFSVAAALVLSIGCACQADAGEVGKTVLVSASQAHSSSDDMTAARPLSSNNGKITLMGQRPPAGPVTMHYTPVPYSAQTGLQQMADGFRQYLSSLRPDIKYSEDTHTQEVFMVIHLDTFLTPGFNRMKNLEGGKQLAAILKDSPALMITDTISLKPNLSASYIKNPQSSTSMNAHNDLAFKPFIRNPFQNGAISLSLPIPVTESLTISPSVTYAFSIYDNVRQEYRGKAVINLIDKDSAIVYTGILLKYTF